MCVVETLVLAKLALYVLKGAYMTLLIVKAYKKA